MLLSADPEVAAATVVPAHPVRMRILEMPRVFAPTGKTAYLLDHFGLSADARAAVRVLLGGGHGDGHG